jgi:hypothetical protein
VWMIEISSVGIPYPAATLGWSPDPVAATTATGRLTTSLSTRRAFGEVRGVRGDAVRIVYSVSLSHITTTWSAPSHKCSMLLLRPPPLNRFLTRGFVPNSSDVNWPSRSPLRFSYEDKRGEKRNKTPERSLISMLRSFYIFLFIDIKRLLKQQRTRDRFARKKAMRCRECGKEVFLV